MSSKSFSNSNVRCVTLIGHVDHGKSSYADSLLAANGIISSRMAGKVRYLDSREDEQERGITMEASAVSLTFKLRRHAALGGKGKGPAANGTADQKDEPVVEDFMINLIDTPGHVDFSSEVSTASRLCDGALVIVDVVEGVCTQTITVLRQAWADRLRPILVINKMDRLVTELRLTPFEAYHHLQQLIEQVNAVMGSFFASERMEDDLRWREEREKRIASKKEAQDAQAVAAAAESADADAEDIYEDHDDEDIYFDPSRGNVIFASAIDNWAFRLERFSVLYAKKLGVVESRFRKVLWGDFYFDPKQKRVIGQKQKDKEKRVLKPMFVQFVLENIWAVYDSVALNRDQDKIEKIVKTLDLKVLPRDLKSKDTSGLISTIFSQWLPLAPCTFSAVVSNVPSPQEAQATRVPKMLHPDLSYFATPADLEPKTAVQADMFAARADPADKVHTVAYISKMFAARREDLPESQRKALTADEMRSRAKEARERARAIQAATGAAVQEASEGVPLEEAVSLQQASQSDAANAKPDEPNGHAEAQQLSDEVVIGFSRLYSGRLRVGQSIVVVLPKYQPSLGVANASNAKHIKHAKIEALYMLMGRELIAVDQVPAGNVFGIRGLEGIVLRNATLLAPPGEHDDLQSWLASPAAKDIVNLSGVNSSAAPIVRVALEPKNPSDMPKLVEGLKLLNQADPCVQVLVQETGEHVIIGAGELHVERCLKDLQERFAKCEIQASPPIVPFRETAVKAADMAPPKTEGEPRGTIIGKVANQLVSYRIRGVPMPTELTAFLAKSSATIRRLQRERRGEVEDDSVKAAQSLDGQEGGKVLTPEQFWSALEEQVAKCGPDWKDIVEHIWSFGPRRVGPNLLLDRAGLLPQSLRVRSHNRHLHLTEGRPSSGIATPAERADGSAAKSSADKEQTLEEALQTMQLDNSTSGDERSGQVSFSSKDMNDAIEAGFQMAMLQGPMCAEPVQGMAYFVEEVTIDRDEALKEGARVRLSQITGSLLSSVRESCKQALLDWSPRLMMAMYSCDIQASTEVLGKVHAVLSRRRGRITSEEMKEGTSFFTVGALLPVVESFGFADEIRKRTSGAASPQLVFAGFELFDLDPFWVPRTEEELEDLGEKGERENVAERYMNQVRKRKGLFVTKRIVEAAEKQRTLKSN